MQADLNAIALIVTIAATVYVVIRFGDFHSPIRMARINKAVGLAFVLWLVEMIFLGVSMCMNGNPITQMLIPNICIMLVFIFVANGTLRNGAIVALTFMAITLSLHFRTVVQLSEYTGNPHMNEGMVRSIRKSLEQTDDKVMQQDLKYKIKALERRKIVSVWHTDLTGIYAVVEG